MQDNKHHEFLAIDLLRGIASLAVIVWHYQAVNISAHGGPDKFHALISTQPLHALLKLFYDYGYLAVPLFWSISGFVFASTYVKTRKSARHFFVSRFARLYPLHFATLLLVAALQFFSVHEGLKEQIYPNNDLYHFMLNLFFASNWGFEKGNSFNGPIWSVSIEIVVYLIFFVSIPFIARLRFIGPALLVLFFYELLTYSVPGVFWACGYFFFIGALVFSITDRLGSASFLLGVGALSYWGTGGGYGLIDARTWYALPLLCAGFLLCVAAIDKARIGVPLLRRFAWIGESTYSTYLLHIPVLIIVLITFKMMHTNWPMIFNSDRFFIPFIVVVFALGRLSFLYFERPAQRMIMDRLRGSNRSILSPALGPDKSIAG